MRETLPVLALLSLFILLLFAPQSNGGDVVCTLFLKASFRSMFIDQADPSRMAEDHNQLCDICSRLARLGISALNDERISRNWKQVVRDRGCSMEIEDREKDCQTLAEAILSSQADYFTSEAVKLTPEETNTTETLTLAVQSKAHRFCANIRCCKIRKHAKSQSQSGGSISPQGSLPAASTTTSNSTSNAVLANSTLAAQKQAITEDRTNLNHDLELMDAMKDNLDKYNQRLSKERARLEKLDKSLLEKQKEILTGVMRERMMKKAKELEERAAEQARKAKQQEDADDLARENAEAQAKGKGNAKLKPESPEQLAARKTRSEERKKKKEKAAFEKKKLLEAEAKADAAIPNPTDQTNSTTTSVKFRSNSIPSADESSDSEDTEEIIEETEAAGEDAGEEVLQDEDQAQVVAQPGDM